MKKYWVFFKIRMLMVLYDRMALFFSYVLPIILVLGLGYAFSDSERTAIQVVYPAQLEKEPYWSELAPVRENPLIQLRKEDLDLATGIEWVRRNKIAFLIDASLDRGNQAPRYALYYNMSDPHNRLYALAIENILHGSDRPANGKVVSQPLLSTPQKSYIHTLLPGIIGMTIMVIGLSGFAAYLIAERERNVFKKIKTIHASLGPFLGGMFLSRLVAIYAMVFLLFSVSRFAFGVENSGSYVLVFILVTLASLTFLGLGLILIGWSPTQASFNGLNSFIQIPFVVFSGVFFSVERLPAWLQMVSGIMPLTHFNVAMQKVIFEGVTVFDMAPIAVNLLILGIWAVVTVVWSSYQFKW